MIYLIGGPPRTGKTTTAAALAARVGCSWCSTDWLASAMNPYSHGPDGEARPSRLLPDKGNDERYASFTADEIVANYRERAAYFEHGILWGFVEYALHDQRDFVVEGFHLEPRAMAARQADWPDDIRSVVLVRGDERELARSLPQGSGVNDWAVKFTNAAATFDRMAAMIVRYGEVVTAEALDAGIPVVDTSGSLAAGTERASTALLADGGGGPRLV